MSTRETLTTLIDTLPEERLRQLLEFAQFLSLKAEHDEWLRSGLDHFAKAFGPDEPDYSALLSKPSASS